MSEHENATPRPWRVGVGIDNLLPCVDASDGFGGTVEICEVWGVQSDKVEDKGSRANAALIVEAVNAYDTLRAENERLKAENEKHTREYDAYATALSRAFDNWKDAVARAEAAEAALSEAQP